MIYLKAVFAGTMAALLGAVLYVVLPLCVQLIRFRWRMRHEAGIGAVSIGIGVGSMSGLLAVVLVCFTAGCWWIVRRG